MLLYRDATQCDQQFFAEARSNLLLIAGDHYSKKGISQFFRRVRDQKDLGEEQKLRLTKNHIQKIVKTYANQIVSSNPGVGFEPKHEADIDSQKAAELDHAVWRDAVEKYSIDEKIDDWVDDFVGVGEVATKIFWDPSLGKPTGGYELLMGEDGNPIPDETGAPQYDQDKPIFSGEFVFEPVYGFNLKRAPEAKTMSASPYLIVDKMVGIAELIRKFPDKEKVIIPSGDETFVVFDSTRGGYRRTDKECMLIEHYYRPCSLYPNGYFYFDTKDGPLAEGELPAGVFPLVVQAWDKIQTSCRGMGPVKIMRPYQAEINRGASKMAEHQVTLGDDKLIIQDGSKVSAGVALPGVRSINVSGMAPTVMEGRDGSQYLATIQANITEMYQVMNVDEGNYDKDGQIDPFMMLFRASHQKMKFQRYIRRFERFLINVVKTYIDLARVHLPDDALIQAVGSNERVNIPEFKKANASCYDVKIEPQSDDLESKLGKQMALNHVLQYVGPQMKPDDIGKVMRAMPYANFDNSFDDMTIDFDSAQNDILALERGERPPVHPYDNHVYMVKRLVSRMRQASFNYLDPQVQQAFISNINLHQAFEAQNQLQIQRAEQGYIPTGGYMVACDLYVSDPSDTTGVKTRRARIPYEALQWLIQHLESQGQGLQQLENMNEGAQAQIAQHMNSSQPQNGPSNGMVGPSSMGPPVPGGVNNDDRTNPGFHAGSGYNPQPGAGIPAQLGQHPV